jgi:hypothetical protein
MVRVNYELAYKNNYKDVIAEPYFDVDYNDVLYN